MRTLIEKIGGTVYRSERQETLPVKVKKTSNLVGVINFATAAALGGVAMWAAYTVTAPEPTVLETVVEAVKFW